MPLSLAAKVVVVFEPATGRPDGDTIQKRGLYCQWLLKTNNQKTIYTRLHFEPVKAAEARRLQTIGVPDPAGPGNSSGRQLSRR
jgi:hypothetical protein